MNQVIEELCVSERRACRVLNQVRSTQQYKPKIRDDEERLVSRIVALVSQYGRCGYRGITVILLPEVWRVNHKPVERVWRQKGLKVPNKQPKRDPLWLTWYLEARKILF